MRSLSGAEPPMPTLSTCTPKAMFLVGMVTCPMLFFFGFGLVTVARLHPYSFYGVLLVCLVANLLILAAAFLCGVLVRRFRGSWYTWVTVGLMFAYSVLLGQMGGH
jgi:hypothetical protein